jgi:hypothetical protein
VTRELLRAIGRWDLFALVINGIVGAEIFGLSAKVHALLGANGLWAIIARALIIGLVVLCFAEVASRFTQTGGPFVYAGTAFGPLTGFLTGWILLAARLTGCCAICSLLLEYAAYFVPGLNPGAGRVLGTLIIVGTLTLVHVLGIKPAAFVFAAKFENAQTIASGVRVPAAVGDFMILDAVRASGSTAVAAPERAIEHWMRKAISLEGLSICPETAVCFGALEMLLARGEVKTHERITSVALNDAVAEKLHFLQLGAELQEKQIDARLLKLADLFLNLRGSSDQPRAQSAI